MDILCIKGQEFTDLHPSNTFNTTGIGLKTSKGLMPFNRLYNTRNLVFVVQSEDDTEDYFLYNCEEFNQHAISSAVKILSETPIQDVVHRFPLQHYDGNKTKNSIFL
jgi:hypothetical protein